jgi:Flp pilus assembly protein protease CpaA
MILNDFFFFFFYSNIVLFYCMYRDIKFRIIPNKVLSVLLLISSFLIFIELLHFYNNVLIFIIVKIWFLFFAFFLSFLLYCLKIIGGSDGKLLTMLFLFNPIYYLNFQWLFLFFSVLLLLYLILGIISYLITHNLTNKNVYEMFFSENENFSKMHKIFIEIFYKFRDFSQLNKFNDEKYLLKSLILFYNNKTEKIQFLTQYRPPIVILIFFTYNFLIFNYLC